MYTKMTVKFSDYDVEALKFEERTYGRKMTFWECSGDDSYAIPLA